MRGFAAGLLALAVSAACAEEISFHDDYRDALEVAEETERPILLVFR